MKPFISRAALLGLALFSFSSLHAAFNPAVVSADAQWVFHADLNTLRGSVIGKELVTAVEKMQLATADTKIGVDVPKLLTTIGTMTAYGSNFTSDPKSLDGALVVRGTPDLRKIAEAALVQATVTTPESVSDIKGLPFPAYLVVGKMPVKDATAKEDLVKAAVPMDVIVAFPTDSDVIITKSRAQLLKARDVLLGTAPNLAKNSSSTLGSLVKNAGSSYLFVASVVPTDKFFTEDAPQARILQMANSGSVSLGENGPLTVAHVELIATSDEMADKLIKILQGMTAMMSLAETNDKQLSEFLSSAAVTRNEKAVSLNLAYASDRLVEMVKNLQADQSRGSKRSAVNNGKVVGEWKSSEAEANGDGLTTKTFENVKLVNGTTLVLVARKAGSHIAQLDRIEIVPAQGQGAALTFRSDSMKLSGWSEDSKPGVSGGKTITARAPTSTARVAFPGATGIYSIKVIAVGDTEDASTLTLSTRDPESAKPAVKTQD